LSFFFGEVKKSPRSSVVNLGTDEWDRKILYVRWVGCSADGWVKGIPFKDMNLILELRRLPFICILTSFFFIFFLKPEWLGFVVKACQRIDLKGNWSLDELGSCKAAPTTQFGYPFPFGIILCTWFGRCWEMPCWEAGDGVQDRY